MLSVAVGDFDGDGFDDMAVGKPDATVGPHAMAGIVQVRYGAAGGGLKELGKQVWSQDSPGIPGAARPGDAFGSSLAVGDFDGDGYDDLAIGVPLDDVGTKASAGGVNIIYGSSRGLRSWASQYWTQDSPLIRDSAETGDRFGATLAAGDFNRDGYDDLAIGVPSEDLRSAVNAGAINVIFGSARRLTGTGNQFGHQNSPGIVGIARRDDAFGSALAVGDFNADGYDDLSIGVPGKDVRRIQDAGAVNVLYGSEQRLTRTGNQYWTQNSAGIRDVSERGDRFGWALAAGDFNRDGYDDLAIGVPFEDVGRIVDAGAVNVIYGSARRLTSTNNQYWTQSSVGVRDVAEAGDRFGWALAAGDFNRDGYDDLVSEVPFEDVGAILDVGAVNVFYGAAGGLSNSGIGIFS
jgi:hypothetical protein